MKEALSCIGDALFHLFYNWRASIGRGYIAEAEAISQCILQISVRKIRTLLAMCEGVLLIPNELSTKALDIPSMCSVLRSLCELAFMFHNIYAEQDTKAERDLVLCLWKISGLNNRQNLKCIPSQYKTKEENEKEQIKKLKEKIFVLAGELKLPRRFMLELEGMLRSSSVEIKGYKFKKDEESNVTSFESIRFAQGIEALLGEHSAPLYRFLSMQAHPSYLGVLQFGQMFNQNEDTKYLKTILTSASIFASTVALDFRDNIAGAKDAFDALPERERHLVINFVEK